MRLRPSERILRHFRLCKFWKIQHSLSYDLNNHFSKSYHDKINIQHYQQFSYVYGRDLYVDNHICREGEFYTALKLSQRRVHLFDWRVNLEKPFIYDHRKKHEKQATPISLISGHSAALVPVLSSNFLRAALQVLPPPQPKPMIFKKYVCYKQRCMYPDTYNFA